jgi:hypothetical protein
LPFGNFNFTPNHFRANCHRFVTITTFIRSFELAALSAMRRIKLKHQAVLIIGLVLITTILLMTAHTAVAETADSTDLMLNLFIEKGYVSKSEAEKVKTEAAKRQAELEQYKAAAETFKTEAEQLRAEVATFKAQSDFNQTNIMPELSNTKVGNALDKMEIFGTVGLRYESRAAGAPTSGKIDLERERYSVRLGLRGTPLDDFYYGLRVETSSNPRSSWVTMGTSSSGLPYQGPYGKSTAGIGIGQVYLGWRPASWFDLTVGKMPNPLYTTTMVWNSTINPEGVAEHFKYTVGEADFFATFGQFLYQDENPMSASGGLGVNGLLGQTVNNIYQVAWQGGVNYHITTNISAKVGATIYQYYGMKQSSTSGGIAPYYGDPYVGEGAYTGPGSANNVDGASGYGTSSTFPGYESLGYPNNQVGLDHLLVLEIPFELNFKVKKWDARVFGDVAYNFQGRERAAAAAAGYGVYLANQYPTPATISPFSPQTDDCKAYQLGFAFGSEGSLGLVNGTTSKKHAWEVRTYWQHVEQYALDPNLVDTDFFGGAQNLQGLYASIAYGFNENVIGAIRFGQASRINKKLGTGGTGQDIPQINPVNSYSLFQVDLTVRF